MGMDKECINICEAMNKLPGIETTESCCGHNKYPYRIFFHVDHLDALPALVYHFAGCHCGNYNWNIIAKTDCSMRPISFMAEGPIGEEAYQSAEYIAKIIEEYMKEEISP